MLVRPIGILSRREGQVILPSMSTPRRTVARNPSYAAFTLSLRKRDSLGIIRGIPRLTALVLSAVEGLARDDIQMSFRDVLWRGIPLTRQEPNRSG